MNVPTLATEPLRYSAKNATGGAAIQPPVEGVDLGHSYPAYIQRDGAYQIRGLDIFKACERMNPSTKQVDHFDEAWLEDAVRKFNERKNSEHYLPPVHVGHNTPNGNSKEFAGFMDNLRMDKDANGIPTLRADLVNIPAPQFAEILGKRRPYRSVEINFPAKREISSLALLDTEVPYFKMPLTIVDPVNFADAKGVCFAEMAVPDPVTGAALAIVQRFDAHHAALTEQTKFRQRFAQYFDKRDGYLGQDDTDEDDGDDPLDGMSHEDIQALLAQLHGGGQQQQGAGEPAGMDQGQGGGAPMMEDDMAAGNPGGGAQAVIQALAPMMAEISQGLKSLAQGGTQMPAAPNPPPTHCAEGAANKAAFAEKPAVAAAPAGDMPAWAAALRDENKALGDKLASLAKNVQQLFAEREYGMLAQHFNEALDAQAQALVKEGRFSQATINDAYGWAGKIVFQELDTQFNQGIDAEKITKTIDPSAKFAEYLKGRSPDATVNTGGRVNAPVGSTNGAAPTSAAASNIDPARAKAFAEKHKCEALYDANPQRFSEVHGQATADWAQLPERTRGFHGNVPENFIDTRIRSDAVLAALRNGNGH